MTEQTDFKMDVHGFQPWLGRDENDFFTLMEAETRGQEIKMTAEEVKVLLYSGADEDEFQGYGNMIQKLDNGVAVISIQGSMSDKETIWTRVFGVPTYPGISNALLASAMHDEVKGVVLDWDSTGGKAKGHMQLVDTIKMLTSKGFPVYSYASGDMMSAAIWTGTAADKVYASKDAALGSIGVIAVHMDATQAYKERGIKHTVFRAGANKAPVTPFEPLTAKAKAYLENFITVMHGKFITGVAENIGESPAYVRAKMGDGSEFEAQEAKDLRLIDGVKTFDQAMDALLKRIDRKPGQSANTNRNFNVGANAMPDSKNVDPNAQIAAIMAATGVTAEAATKALIDKGILPDPTAEDTSSDPTPNADSGKPEAEADAGKPEGGDNPNADDGKPEGEGDDAAPAASGDQSALVAMISQLQGEVTEAKISLSKAEDQVNVLTAASAGYRAAMVDAVKELRIGLGRPGNTDDLKDATDATVLAAYTTHRADVAAAFPTGQVSASADRDDPNDKVVASAHADTLRKVTSFSRSGN